MEQIWVLVSVSFALGLCVGSFLNVVIHRVPVGESIVMPRSRCPGCRSPIAGRDNVPLLSYLLLRGRCRHCQRSIGMRYPLVELLTGLIFAAIAWRTGLHPLLPIWMAFGAALIAAAAIDFDHQFIPDSISVGGTLVALVAVPTAKTIGGVPMDAAILDSAVGAMLGAGMLWVVGFGHARVCSALGRTFPHWPGDDETLPTPGSVDYWTWFPGLGFGDVKLMGMIGACLGPSGVVVTVALAAFIGLIWGAIAAFSRGTAALPFGFGPALAIGALVALVGSAELLPFFFPTL